MRRNLKCYLGAWGQAYLNDEDVHGSCHLKYETENLILVSKSTGYKPGVGTDPAKLILMRKIVNLTDDHDMAVNQRRFDVEVVELEQTGRYHKRALDAMMLTVNRIEGEMTQARYYREKIAPELNQLMYLCRANRMSFMSHVEYGDLESIDSETIIRTGSGISTVGFLIVQAARAKGDVDALISALLNQARQSNTIQNSLYLNLIDQKIGGGSER